MSIGATVTLFWRDGQGRPQEQLQQVSAASGFCAQNDHRLHFGLGQGAQVQKAVIRWPRAGASPQTVPASSLPVGRVIQIREPS